VLYSLSFAPNSNFTTFYPRQPEILTYIKSVAEKYKLGNKISCNMRLEQASWLPETSRWHLELKNLKTEKTFYQECKILISAVGVFATPNTSMDQIRGLQDFKGQVMHTAQWDETVDLKGKRVAIVGNGGSSFYQIFEALEDF
jgi:cation diffusion facilitator CzcD-associated flavoprotein CzcO